MNRDIAISLAQAENDLDGLIETMRKEGVVIVKGLMSEQECDEVKAKLDRILDDRLAKGHYCGNETNQVLDNYFMEDHSLLDMLYQDLTDKVMRRLIDDDYVIISPSARNRREWEGKHFGRRTSGFGWHTDSRFIGGGQGFKPSLCYMSIICIDPFTTENGATHYIPKSHLFYERPGNRDMEPPYTHFVADKGDMVIFDTALWHRIGPATSQSRWGVFNTYGPWFMKPYHRFNEMFTEEEAKEFPPIIRQLLHYDSIPPLDHNESMITLRRVREAVEK